MAVSDWIAARLRGTAQSLFRIGLSSTTSVQLKNSAGVLEARDATDAAYIVGRGATPVAANDWATKDYVDTAAPTGTLTRGKALATFQGYDLP